MKHTANPVEAKPRPLVAAKRAIAIGATMLAALTLSGDNGARVAAPLPVEPGLELVDSAQEQQTVESWLAQETMDEARGEALVRDVVDPHWLDNDNRLNISKNAGLKHYIFDKVADKNPDPLFRGLSMLVASGTEARSVFGMGGLVYHQGKIGVASIQHLADYQPSVVEDSPLKFHINIPGRGFIEVDGAKPKTLVKDFNPDLPRAGYRGKDKMVFIEITGDNERVIRYLTQRGEIAPHKISQKGQSHAGKYYIADPHSGQNLNLNFKKVYHPDSYDGLFKDQRIFDINAAPQIFTKNLYQAVGLGRLDSRSEPHAVVCPGFSGTLVTDQNGDVYGAVSGAKWPFVKKPV